MRRRTSALVLGAGAALAVASLAQAQVPASAASADAAPADAAPADADVAEQEDAGAPPSDASASFVAAEAVDASPRASVTPSHAIEVDLFGGLTRMTAPTVDHRGESDSTNGGFGAALSVTYRTAYFLSPYLDVGYWPLYANEQNVDLGSAGGLQTVKSRLATWGVSAGAGWDLWRLRVRAGIGVYDVMVHTKVLGLTVSPTELDMGYAFSFGGTIYKVDRFSIGAEARLVLIIEAGTTFMAIGPTFSGDLFRW